MSSAATLVDSRYRLGPLIARGGMSDVYRAVDEQTGAAVAVKVVRAGDPALARRMAREAQALESVDHPNLVRLLDSGLIDSQAYLVMTYVDGPTLGARLGVGPLEPGEAAAVGAAVADALDYIHARGIVHRDVKPANVLITATGQACLSDFGVARLADASTITLAGTTLGTVSYMAPEQLENHQVGPSADVWSLGVVLLESLTGRRVYTGSPSEVIARRLAEPDPVPAAIPEPWNALLSRMLVRSPEERPTAHEVGEQLRNPAYVAPWEPWGQPASPEGEDTAPLPASAVRSEAGTDVYALGNPRSTPQRRSRRRRLFVAGLVALVSAGALGGWAASGGSTAPKSPTVNRPAESPSPTSRPPGPATVPPVSATPPAPTPTPNSELSVLSSQVNAGVAAGLIANKTGAAVTKQARQAVTDFVNGRADQAASDLQQAAKLVSAGVDDGSITPSKAQVLNNDLSALGSTLGVRAVPPPPATAAPRPPGHRHHGGGNDD
jgi:serine/threonine protein kinase